MTKVRRLGRLVLLASTVSGVHGSATAQGPTPVVASPGSAIAHPELWPKAHSPAALTDARTERFVAGLLVKMSVEEKVGQLVQGDTSSLKPEDLRQYPLGSVLSGGNSPPLGGPERSPAPVWAATADAYRKVSLEARPGHVPIPTIYGVDVIHGNSNVVGATLFPHAVGLGAMHDLALVERIGKATAEETAAAGVDWAFWPTVATVRDNRWGRSYESYSEEPAETAAWARAMVRGLQGDPAKWPALQQGRVAASSKHFLGDGGTNGKDQGENASTEAELIRITAPAYAAAVDAGTMTVMASYNSWHGVKMHGNQSLLTGMLKGQMGFQGFVVGDWNAQGQLPGCTNVHCPLAINAGVDMIMAPDSWKGFYTNTLADVREGRISMARLDDAVTRILRVKARLGLFENRLPWENRAGVMGAPEHRAIAREAVAKSLVLLKNDGATLPLRGNAHVLIAGDGADNIGKQAGGWTYSWQGTGNTNADFPTGTSIGAGIAAALKAAGGRAEINPAGKFTTKPDVAIVVIGEEPYAEFQGDIATLEYQPGEHYDLELIRSLKAQGIKVVTVFLSGRPLWVNPEINASDAFVAAWLPGSEGGGVADVLVGDAAGRPRRDFNGTLNFSWPKTAAQYTLNKGDPGYDPQFARGYGLRYASARPLGVLPEVSGVSAAVVNTSDYFTRGRVRAPWHVALTDAGGTVALDRQGVGASRNGTVRVEAVDAAGVQEAGRRVTWSGKAPGTLAFAGDPIDLGRQTNGDVSISIVYRLDSAAPGAPVRLSLGDPAKGVNIASLIKPTPGASTGSVKVTLKCLRAASADVASVATPIRIDTNGTLALTLVSATLSGDPNDAVCPAS